MDEDVAEFLEHFGVKGMHWGVRKDRPAGVSRSVDRHARTDAAEFARAKAYYGEGAGTRRKLIKQTVEAKSKRLPGYQKAFDHHLNNQDMSKHASKAVSERNRTDRHTRNKQRSSAVLRRVTGERGTQAAIVASVAGGVAFLKSPAGRSLMQKGSKKVSDLKNTQQAKKGVKLAAEFLNKQRWT